MDPGELITRTEMSLEAAGMGLTRVQLRGAEVCVARVPGSGLLVPGYWLKDEVNAPWKLSTALPRSTIRKRCVRR